MSASQYGARSISLVLMFGLLFGSVPVPGFAQEFPVCPEGEVYSTEIESCVSVEVPAEEVTVTEGSSEFCSIVSDPITQEGAEPAIVVSVLSEFWTAVIGNAFWIWGEDPIATPDETTTEVFTRTFAISGIPYDAELHIAADDGYVAKLNGVTLGQDNGMDAVNFTLSGQDTYSIDTGLFVLGENTLTVEATNIAWGVGEENPAGILFRLDMQGVSCTTGGGNEENFGTLVIEKELQGGDENAFFTFSIQPEEGDSSLLVVETEGRYGTNQKELAEGWYTVSEIVPKGWTLGSIVCNDEDSIEFAITSEETVLSETVYLDIGEEITCVFTNIKDAVEETKKSDGNSTGNRVRSPGNRGGLVLGASTECSPLLMTYLGKGFINAPEEVTKLQNFLNEEMDMELPLSGAFDEQTEEAVHSFQIKHWEEVLKPWFGLPGSPIQDSDDSSGIVFKTTKWKINNLFCPGSEAMPMLP
jgi:hypothetical protein